MGGTDKRIKTCVRRHSREEPRDPEAEGSLAVAPRGGCRPGRRLGPVPGQRDRQGKRGPASKRKGSHRPQVNAREGAAPEQTAPAANKHTKPHTSPHTASADETETQLSKNTGKHCPRGVPREGTNANKPKNGQLCPQKEMPREPHGLLPTPRAPSARLRGHTPGKPRPHSTHSANCGPETDEPQNHSTEQNATWRMHSGATRSRQGHHTGLGLRGQATGTPGAHGTLG